MSLALPMSSIYRKCLRKVVFRHVHTLQQLAAIFKSASLPAQTLIELRNSEDVKVMVVKPGEILAASLRKYMSDDLRLTSDLVGFQRE